MPDNPDQWRDPIHAKVIIEMLGAPKEHLENTLRLVLQRFREEQDVQLISGQVHKPKEKDKLFSCFAELDANLKDFKAVARICFDYMPSSIEILSPTTFKRPSAEIASFINDMLTLLHQIDFKLKDSNARQKLLERNSTNLLRNLILEALPKPRPISDLAKASGIPASQLINFLNAFAKEGIIKQEFNLWSKTENAGSKTKA